MGAICQHGGHQLGNGGEILDNHTRLAMIRNMTISEFLDTLKRIYELKNKTESVALAAKFLGITQGSIWKWLKADTTPSHQSLVIMHLIIKLTQRYGAEEILSIYDDLY